jgi:hypothetical protein
MAPGQSWQWNSYYGNVIFIFYSADKTKLISIYIQVVGEDLLKNVQSTALSYCLVIENINTVEIKTTCLSLLFVLKSIAKLF